MDFICGAGKSDVSINFEFFGFIGGDGGVAMATKLMVVDFYVKGWPEPTKFRCKSLAGFELFDEEASSKKCCL